MGTGKSKIENLESIPENNPPGPYGNQEESAVIEEREGIHYISGEVLESKNETGETLDRDFKDLVDSIIK